MKAGRDMTITLVHVVNSYTISYLLIIEPCTQTLITWHGYEATHNYILGDNGTLEYVEANFQTGEEDTCTDGPTLTALVLLIMADLLDSIASDLRSTVPLDALAPGEQTLVPSEGHVRNTVVSAPDPPCTLGPRLGSLLL